MVVRELATILVFLPGILSVSQNKEDTNEDQVGINFQQVIEYRCGLQFQISVASSLFDGKSKRDHRVQGKIYITTRISTIATNLHHSPRPTRRNVQSLKKLASSVYLVIIAPRVASSRQTFQSSLNPGIDVSPDVFPIREAPLQLAPPLFGHCPNSNCTPPRTQTGTLGHFFSGPI